MTVGFDRYVGLVAIAEQMCLSQPEGRKMGRRSPFWD